MWTIVKLSRIVCLMLLFFVGIIAVANGDPISVNVSVDGMAEDAGNDGTFETLDTSGDRLYITNIFDVPEAREDRALLEFDLSAFTPGDTINSLSLTILQDYLTYWLGYEDETIVDVWGYFGNGNLTTDDATADAIWLGSYYPTDLGISGPEYSISLDPSYLQSLIDESSSYLGLRLQKSVEDVYLGSDIVSMEGDAWGETNGFPNLMAARLDIDYTPALPDIVINQVIDLTTLGLPSNIINKTYDIPSLELSEGDNVVINISFLPGQRLRFDDFFSNGDSGEQLLTLIRVSAPSDSHFTAHGTFTFHDLSGSIGIPLDDIEITSGTAGPFLEFYEYDAVATGQGIEFSGVTVDMTIDWLEQPAPPLYNALLILARADQIDVVESLPTTLRGVVLYNEAPYLTNSAVNFWARNDDTGEEVTIDPVYNALTGEYSIPGLLPGRYGFQVTIDEEEPYDGRYRPGDFYGWNEPITIIGDGIDVVEDLRINKVIHLTSPIDNSFEQNMSPPYDRYDQQDIFFQWDPINEASDYMIEIERYRSSPYELLEMYPVQIIGATEVTISLPWSEENEHYQFSLYARNSNGSMVGQLVVNYFAGLGWDYRFRIGDAYAPIPLPLNPDGSDGEFQLYEFDDNYFNFGVKYGEGSPPGINLVVQPILITQDDLNAMVAGSDFNGANLVPYDGTGGKGVLFRVTCEYDVDHTPVECPIPVDEYEVKTAWWPPPGDQTIVAPAYLKAPTDTNLWEDILSSYYEDRFDGMAIGHTCCHYSDFVFVDMWEGSDMGTLLPSINITSPADGAVYTLSQYVTAEYSCSAGALCSGTTDNGSPIDTSSLGMKAFGVVATVASDSSTNGAVSYIKSVSYNVVEIGEIQLLYDPNRKVRSGAAYPIKLQVLDINGKNVSASSLVLTAVDVINGSVAEPNYTGHANPDNNFRFDPALSGGGYIYNLSTMGLETGIYAITFVINGGQQLYYAQFKVR